MLSVSATGAAGAIVATLLRQQARGTYLLDNADAAPDPRIQGPFLILSTPFTASGAVDFDALARQACYVDWCGCPGMIWPQSGDSVDLLTTDEKLQGMEVLAKTARKLQHHGAVPWRARQRHRRNARLRPACRETGTRGNHLATARLGQNGRRLAPILAGPRLGHQAARLHPDYGRRGLQGPDPVPETPDRTRQRRSPTSAM